MATLHAERHDFDRYQPVIERQMFGALPPDFDPEKMPSEVTKTSAKGEEALTKEQEQIKSAIRFTSINITPTGETAVGFMDNTDPKVPHHYYLKVGEKRNGWELKEADAEKATMTIAKGEVEVSLSLGGDSSKSAGATSKRQPAERPNRSSLLGGNRRPTVGNRPMLKRSEMLAEMRKMEAASKEREAAVARREEELAAQREADAAERAKLSSILDGMKKELAEKRNAEAAKEKEEEHTGEE